MQTSFLKRKLTYFRCSNLSANVSILILIFLRNCILQDHMVALLGIYPEKTRIWKDTFIPSVHCHTVYNTQDTEATYFYIDEWMKMMWYWYKMECSVQFSSVPQSCPTLCDLWITARPGLPVHHQLPEFTQIHVHQSQWCHPAISSSVVPFSSYPNPSQHQSLFQWVNSSHEVAKVLEFQF